MVTKNTPRVLFVSPQPFMAHRGSSFRVKSTVTLLSRCGFDIDLLVYPMGENISLAGVTIFRSLKIPFVRHVGIGPSYTKLFFDFLLFFSALKLVLFRRYTVLHGVEEGAFIVCLLGRLFGIPYIVDMHSQMEQQLCESGFLRSKLLHSLFLKVEIWSIKTAAGVVTVADVLTARSKSVAPAVPAFTANDLPLDFSRTVDAAGVARLKEEHHLENQKVVLYSGNLKSYQGLELLIEAFCKLQELVSSGTANFAQFSPIVLVIVGGGIEEEVDRKKYMALAEDLGIAASVYFVGHRRSEEMGNYFALADVLVSPRISGANTPLKIYSYLAAGKPIVATRISSHTQVLNENCAFLCGVTEDSLAETLLRALDDSETSRAAREKQVHLGKQLLNSRFTEAQFMSVLRELYNGALGRDVAAAEESKQVEPKERTTAY